jgi:hypothetical protein
MNQNELFDALNGLFAYDTGCTDSGVKDETLRAKVVSYLNSLSEDEFRITLSIFIREAFVSEEAINEGYGIEDVKSFIEWMDSHMHTHL